MSNAAAFLRLASVGLVRAPVRSAVRVVTLAAAVALLAAMLLFIGHSLRTMTGGAVRSVPLHWQGPVPSAAAARRDPRRVAPQPRGPPARPDPRPPLAAAPPPPPGAGTRRAGAGPTPP